MDRPTTAVFRGPGGSVVAQVPKTAAVCELMPISGPEASMWVTSNLCRVPVTVFSVP